MGACSSSGMTAEEKQLAIASREIDRRGREAQKVEQGKIKLLLLGAGESGKSTIFKQMRILYGAHHGYTEEERKQFTVTIYGNILTNFKAVLEQTSTYGPLESEDLKENVEAFMQIPDGKDATIDEDVGAQIKAYWSDPGFQATWHARSNFQVQDALAYYCSEMDRLMSPKYIPSPQDILRTRVRTSGIVEETYVIDKIKFVMFDVGGQRNERKKWIHCFDDVTAIIFVAAINEYDQVLFEDQTMNRLDEAVILFGEICNSIYFENTSMILFLNKKDLFREKLAEVPFRVTEADKERYIDYEGPNLDDQPRPSLDVLYESTKKYILQLFVNRNKNKNKEIYSHVTCATDTANVEVVFNAAKDIILQNNLRRSGFVIS